MSKAVKGFMLMAIAVGFIMIFLTTSGRASRSNENTNALVTAIDDSLKNVMEQKAYEISNSNEFIADFLEALLMQYESDSEITVNILKQDMEKGLLSVEVNEKYKHPNGKDGTVSVQRTVIFDKKADEEPVFYDINYWVNGELYKTYSILEGEQLITPETPSSDTGTFMCWKDRDSGNIVNNIEDLVSDNTYHFSAVFH